MKFIRGSWFTTYGGKLYYWMFKYKTSQNKDRFDFGHWVRLDIHFNWWRIPNSFKITHPIIQETCDTEGEIIETHYRVGNQSYIRREKILRKH